MNRTVGRVSLWVLTASLLIASPSAAPVNPNGHDLLDVINGNERFGRALLARLRTNDPDRNIVLSPISLSLMFAAIRGNTGDAQLDRELEATFGYPALRPYRASVVPFRMLLAAFRQPTELPALPKNATQSARIDRAEQLQEAAWITNALVFRGPRDVLSERFIRDAVGEFGVSVSTGARTPTQADLKQAQDGSAAAPAMTPQNDLLISSGTHLRTSWAGNTFVLSKPHRATFYSSSGAIQVDMLTSETQTYLHAKSDMFEAVVLPCNRAEFVAILPAAGRTISDVERALLETPDVLATALTPALGAVDLPPFHITYEARLREPLEQLGVRRVFSSLGEVVRVPKSHLAEVNQRADITVDQLGIRADAETVGGAIYGGITSAANPFHMSLDRPFLFFVRDVPTSVMLFAGVVTNPMAQRQPLLAK